MVNFDLAEQSQVSHELPQPVPGDPSETMSTPGPLELLQRMGRSVGQFAVIVIDHGSRRAESNQLLLEVTAALRQAIGLKIVEPAHMTLAEPSLQTAFERAVSQGARLVLVFPFFLSPGRHWQQDIPQLAAEASRLHPGVQYLVTAPLGLHPLMLQIIQQRMVQCLSRALGDRSACEVCQEKMHCQIQGGS